MRRWGSAAVVGDVFKITSFECIARSNDRAKHDLNTEKSQVFIVMIIAVTVPPIRKQHPGFASLDYFIQDPRINERKNPLEPEDDACHPVKSRVQLTVINPFVLYQSVRNFAGMWGGYFGFEETTKRKKTNHTQAFIALGAELKAVPQPTWSRHPYIPSHVVSSR